MSIKIKILYLITKSTWGGAGRYVYDLATALPRDEFEPLVASGGSGLLTRRLQAAEIPTITIPYLERDIYLFNDLRVFWQLLKLFRSVQPDIVHLNSSKIGGLGALAGRLTGVKKIIFTGHGWAFNEDRSLVTKIMITIGHWLTITLSHQVIAVCQRIKDQIRNWPGTKRKVEVIYNGLDPYPLSDRHLARQALTKATNFTAKPADEYIWIGMINELHPNKGVDIAIRAFALIASKFPQAHLVIIGEGEKRQELISLIDKLAIAHQVHLAGSLEDARSYLRAFDLFLIASRTEAFPYVLLEAGLARVPVIASRVGGIPEVITHQESGLLFQSKHVDELAYQLEQALSQPQVMKEMAERLAKHIREKFSQNQMTQATINLYYR